MPQKQNLRPETYENPQGVGVLFLLALPKIAKKNPRPPWGVWREITAHNNCRRPPVQ